LDLTKKLKSETGIIFKQREDYLKKKFALKIAKAIGGINEKVKM